MADALAAVNRAVELEPDIPDRHIQRARSCILAGLTDDARESAHQALEFEVSRLDHLLVLGGVLVRCDEHEEALNLYLKSQTVSSDNVDVYRGLASVYRFLGRQREAENAANLAIRLDQHDYEMIGLRSSLRVQTSDDNHIEDLERLKKTGVKNWRGAVHVDYALAKEYEDLGEFEKSFTLLESGARTKRKFTKYDLADDLKIFHALKTAFSQEAVANVGNIGHQSCDPIFILGMPRTGSTLVERIISSHSQVQSLGEVSSFSIEMMKLVEEQSDGMLIDRLALARLAVGLPMKALGRRYLAAVDPIRDGCTRFVDKLPLNSLNIGLISGALPNAKIIHVVRNPLDACYAMYKYLFKNGYPFSYEQIELAAYYAEYHHLMQHWREILPEGRIYDVHYEDIVDDLAGQARKLIDHLGLSWEDSCEEFHTNRKATTTGSASQVRKPVYGSSVGKWRKFERQLSPMRQFLQDADVPIN
ncbi:MAG: sulfotransferase [Gammaproteobacteria bacterium]|nr:sulfotransferase [Gammaproteobacteria bacterium]